MGFARQIQLLLWKNWTLRKRQKVTGAVCGLKVRCRANKWEEKVGWGGGKEGEQSMGWLLLSTEAALNCLAAL